MGFGKTLTIEDAINKIEQKEYLLPAIQREFVWGMEQIERLFDSLMRDYPIGSFLFWEVSESNSTKYEYYEFVRNYHQRDLKHNPRYDLINPKSLVAILDGQQRLTSLFIGLKGSYAEKIPRKRWDNDKAFPKRSLYVNLLSKAEGEDFKYQFKFLTPEKAEGREKDQFWFKVSKILDFNDGDITHFVINELMGHTSKSKLNLATEILNKLHQVIRVKEVIHPFVETDDELNKVLNIFIRVNSAGTELSYSDLLLSIATAQWEDINAREEITHFVDDINKIGGGFNFNKDFVLKSCLVLADIKDIAFSVDNFGSKNMRKIELKWEAIKNSIQLTVNLVSGFGFNRDYLPSNNALIPIAYYLNLNNYDYHFLNSIRFESERKKIKKWLLHSLLKRVFSGQSDVPLRKLRDVINKSDDGKFPIEAIVEEFRGTDRSILFDDDEIENLLSYNYNQKYTFSTLVLLYPSLDFRNHFHMDHIHPTSEFHKNKLRAKDISEEKIGIFKEKMNMISNLQLLEGRVNQSKSNKPFKEWLSENTEDQVEKRDFKRKHYIPDIDLEIENFEEFFDAREDLLMRKFKQLVSFDVKNMAKKT